jgi:hypothetical protein
MSRYTEYKERRRGTVKEDPKKLWDFFHEFIERHRVQNGKRYQLVVSDEDCMKLGEFFIRGMVGWAGDYDVVRELQTRHSPLAGLIVEETEIEELEEEEDASARKSLIH